MDEKQWFTPGQDKAFRTLVTIGAVAVWVLAIVLHLTGQI